MEEKENKKKIGRIRERKENKKKRNAHKKERKKERISKTKN